MAAKTSSYYQTRYRDRLREQGLVKREIWIPPESTKIIKDCEMALRAGITPIIPKVERKKRMDQHENWTTLSLFEALKEAEPVKAGDIEVELIEGADPTLLLTMNEFGDLPIYVSVSGRVGSAPSISSTSIMTRTPILSRPFGCENIA